MDFEKEINKVISVLPRERRSYLFSATMTSKVRKLQRASLADPAKVQVSDKYSTVETLVQNYIFLPAKHKVRSLESTVVHWTVRTFWTITPLVE
mmetsp:Transcript_18104/g.72455  ORF Transcript_18104/g.72455 Transcript_18104/m.72455 type:complete len:94 (-) Transcript_18104:1905-2186(-)